MVRSETADVKARPERYGPRGDPSSTAGVVDFHVAYPGPTSYSPTLTASSMPSSTDGRQQAWPGALRDWRRVAGEVSRRIDVAHSLGHRHAHYTGSVLQIGSFARVGSAVPTEVFHRRVIWITALSRSSEPSSRCPGVAVEATVSCSLRAGPVVNAHSAFVSQSATGTRSRRRRPFLVLVPDRRGYAGWWSRPRKHQSRLQLRRGHVPDVRSQDRGVWSR